ncbi:TetR/AcrR family transcriptional regulator [Candidatus Epulonipiscium viviparus]|uniref:TetR/AcrR family transcriptional regulator n=1 Tax=Candidatus Epulonipiscium viviparus TaxID=420336 RepID=UPI00016C034E|nr:TetR/AcrR family transcriptional regulator [Candidatus Epulopiscium viviparus]
MTSRQLQAYNTKHKIIQCAIDLFQQEDFKDIKIKTICDAADISIGTFYHYFDSKEDIIIKTFEQCDMLLADQQYDLTDLTPEQKIKSILQQMAFIYEKNSASFLSQLLITQLAINNKYLLSTSRYLYTEIYKHFQQGLDQGDFHSSRTAPSLTSSLLRWLRGALYEWCLNEGSYSISNLIQDDATLFFDAIRK